MNEPDSTESSRSRWFTRISIALAAIAALVVLATVGSVVTVYVVTEKYDGLHEAVRKDDKLPVRCLLLRGADVNEKDREGKTPLAIAVGQGNEDIADLLRDHGAKE